MDPFDSSLTNLTTTTPLVDVWWTVPLVVLAVLFLVGIWWRNRSARKGRVNKIKTARERVFLQVKVPREMHGSEDERKDFRELVGVFEPLLASLAGVQGNGGFPVFTLEVLAKRGEIRFLVTTPPEYQEMVERQIHSQYPSAQIEAVRDFRLYEGVDLATDAAQLTLKRIHHFPLKTYKQLELDPLNGLTNALSKLSEQAAAGVQITIKAAGNSWQKGTEKALKNALQGKEIDVKSDFGSLAKDMAKQAVTSAAGKETEAINVTNQSHVEAVQSKLSRQAFQVEIRCVVAAPTKVEARSYLNTLLAAFGQFNAPDRNSFRIFKRRSEKTTRDYLFRDLANIGTMILNTEEVASIFHFPNRYVDTPNIAWLSARTLPPPANLPASGLQLGTATYRGQEKPIFITPEDRLRHIYMIGKTGVGKTVFFENMIEQDIANGQGVCYLDPNGDAIEWILKHIPKERAKDVIYFNPADTARPFGLNLLEWRRPEDKDFLVQESISIFYKLFDPNHTGMIGPQFEHWMRNAALTLMSDPAGGTLIDIPRLFVDDEFMQSKLQFVTDPIVRSFWEKQMAQTTAASKSEMLNYFTSKFGRFMTNDAMRNIIGQAKSSFDFRQVMDEGKILLVNLSKGLIGDLNANLLGMVIISKLQVAAFGRQDVPEEQRRPFYLYVDEFQNFTTDTFATILSEARKYRLSLNITNQYIEQLDQQIRNAVIGNAGTLISFRVGAQDAEYLVKEFEGLSIEDMVNVPKQQFYIKTLINNMPTLPFMGRSGEWDQAGSSELAAGIMELSRLNYGRDFTQVSTEISQRSRVEMIGSAGNTVADVSAITKPS
jgi:hypothetical protein